jgi:sec-independent protein translocase protein TatA
MLFAFMPGPGDMTIIAVVAVLLFGKNLPQVARQAGRALSELKKGMSGLQSELNSAIYSNDPVSTSRQPSYSAYRDEDETDEPTAPKFEPPPAEPRIENVAQPSAGSPARESAPPA